MSLQKVDTSKNYLLNTLNKVYESLKSDEFKNYLVNSGLKAPKITKKGYPSNTQHANYELYAYTSSVGDVLKYDLGSGEIITSIIIEYIMPDNAPYDAWKYSDALMQWFQSESIGQEIIEMYVRTYNKEEGGTSNCCTLELLVRVDEVTDSEVYD